MAVTDRPHVSEENLRMAAQKTMMYVDTLPTKQSMAPRRHCECGPLLAHCHLGLGKG
jgi:hypothetical protein